MEFIAYSKCPTNTSSICTIVKPGGAGRINLRTRLASLVGALPLPRIGITVTGGAPELRVASLVGVDTHGPVGTTSPAGSPPIMLSADGVRIHANVKDVWSPIRGGMGSLSDVRSRTSHEEKLDHLSGSTVYRVEIMVNLRHEKNDIPSILVPLRGAFESRPGIRDVDLGINSDERTLHLTDTVDIDG